MVRRHQPLLLVVLVASGWSATYVGMWKISDFLFSPRVIYSVQFLHWTFTVIIVVSGHYATVRWGAMDGAGDGI